MQLGSGIDSYSSDSFPSMGTSTCHGYGPKSKKKKKKKKKDFIKKKKKKCQSAKDPVQRVKRQKE